MKGSEIISLFKEDAFKASPDSTTQIPYLAAVAQMKMFDIHSRAIGCMCECMGLSAEGNFGQDHFNQTMMKWGMMNEKGERTI